MDDALEMAEQTEVWDLCAQGPGPASDRLRSLAGQKQRLCGYLLAPQMRQVAAGME